MKRPNHGDKITTIIRDLERCAKQNEKDSIESAGAKAVAGEQRRMLKILRQLRLEL